MIYIRGNHPYHFRSGQWAHLFSVQHDSEGRDLWCVEFPDGKTDVWPSWDTQADYDVRVQIEHPNAEEADSGHQVNDASTAIGELSAALRSQAL